MSGRLNVKYWHTVFEEKTLEEAEAIAMGWLKNSKRPQDAVIVYNALESKYEGYEKKELEENVELHDKIRRESAKGASKLYLRQRYGLTAKELDNILKDSGDEKEKFKVPKEPEKESEALNTFKKMKEERDAQKEVSRKKKVRDGK